MFRTHCICCGSTRLQEVINLGMHPMADTFVLRSRLDEADRLYPLICDLCGDCGMVQLRTITNPDERYVAHDYSYNSSNSETSRNHWATYSLHVGAKVGLRSGDFLLEIGSNDGLLAEQFQAGGYRVLGVDPSPVMAKIAAKRGIKTSVGLFDSNWVRKNLGNLPDRPRLVIANNVFNHANEPLDFALGVKEILAPDGTFVFELPYWLASIQQRKFDQIYHEHVTYPTVKSSVELFKRVGLRVVDVEEVDYHGGSLRVYIRHAASSTGAAAVSPKVDEFIAREESAGLFVTSTYRGMIDEVKEVRHRFLAHFYALKARGRPILCVGAAAKGNTFLNYYNLDSTVIDYVTDASPNKVGKFTPRTRIPVVTDEIFRNYDSVYAIILSWNIHFPLRRMLLPINPNIKFLNPYALSHDS